LETAHLVAAFHGRFKGATAGTLFSQVL